jgi:hypothetical protein
MVCCRQYRFMKGISALRRPPIMSQCIHLMLMLALIEGRISVQSSHTSRSIAMNDKQAAAEASIIDQTNLLPKRQLLIVFGVLAISLFICFVDQNGIGVILPTISRDLDAADTISWAGTSALIANTVFQVLFGRLSDLFGQ